MNDHLTDVYLTATPRGRIEQRGHRAFVGGPDPELWYGIGRLQYHFLVAEGLRNSDRFLDIACGSLRLGQFLIPYLDRGCYFGVDGEESLVASGLEFELHPRIAEQKAPRFAFNYDFDFSFVERFDVAMAQSLFTHLVMDDIGRCFENLRTVAHGGSRFYFTYFDGDPASNPEGHSHDQLVWRYRFDDLAAQARQAGWTARCIGDWRHPRGQQMAVAQPT